MHENPRRKFLKWREVVQNAVGLRHAGITRDGSPHQRFKLILAQHIILRDEAARKRAIDWHNAMPLKHAIACTTIRSHSPPILHDESVIRKRLPRSDYIFTGLTSSN